MNLTEMIAKRNTLQAEIDAVTAQIVEAAESQRRELVAVLESVGTAHRRTRKPFSAEARARMAEGQRRRQAAARTNGSGVPAVQ